VDEMLARLLEPLLWRGLKAPHPTVRFQCAQTLFEAFPVQNTEGTRIEQDQALQMQFDCMQVRGGCAVTRGRRGNEG
jgi:condensin-2 complex subunit G2